MQHEIEFKIFDEKNEVFDFDYLTIELDAKVETADSVVGDQCVGTNLYVSEFTWNKSDFTKEPIKPGKTGKITATYNAATVGNFNKTVYVKFLGITEQKSVAILGVVEQ
jgi:hypothetical protein